MSGKKVSSEAPKLLLGKVSSSLKMGIVGLPNVGKSSFFNILCSMSVAAENFPFCTIEPTTSRVPIPDERFDWLVEHCKPASVVPAYLMVTDIAGLVKGASEGQGLGNAFLSHIRAVDGIFYMCRAFEDSDVTHVEGEVDPIRDVEIISHELVLKDIESLQKVIEPLRKLVNSTAKQRKAELETLEKALEMLKEDKPVRSGNWKAQDIEALNQQFLLTAKPAVYLVNLTEDHFIRKKNKWLMPIKQWVDSHDAGAPIIPFSVAFEAKIAEMDPAQRAEYLEQRKVTSSLPKIIKTGYHALHLCHFFTAGPDEVRAWTIHVSTKAPQAAGTIHTDFEKGFICAETIAFNDFKELGSETACKSAGKVLQAGKNYVVQDGDILHIKANTASLPKKK